MRLNRFLKTDEDTFHEIVVELEKNCKPFLKDWRRMTKPGFLHSGRRGDSKAIIRKKVRTNRKALNTPQEISDKLDKFFDWKFKVKPRSNSVFTTGSRNSSASYGNVIYLVFPIGKYKAIWSKHIKDLWAYIQNRTEIVEFYKSGDDISLEEAIDEVVTEYYQEGNIVDAISSRNEIMIVGKEYLAVNEVYKSDLIDWHQTR